MTLKLSPLLGERYVKTKIVIISLLFLDCVWDQTSYYCNLTGREMNVYRIFFVPVHMTKQETEVSRWLDARLGPIKYRLWYRFPRRTIFRQPRIAFKARPWNVYRAHTEDLGFTEEGKREMLEVLQKKRQTMPDSESGPYIVEVEENE